MRVMVIVKASAESEAGIMLAGEGLKPSSQGKRVRFSGTEFTPELRELEERLRAQLPDAKH